MTAPLLGDDTPARKSASHGEAGYVRNARDFYPTEPWVTRALLAAFPDGHFGSPTWEPACGDGRMAEVLFDQGMCVHYSDIHDYGYEPKFFDSRDFLRDPVPLTPEGREIEFEAVITNPPFDQAPQFVRRALEIVRPTQGKVAIVQRHEFDAPKTNWPLFQHEAFAAKLILPRRPRWIDTPPGQKAEAPRFPFAWYVWDWRHQGPPIIRWIEEAKPGLQQGALL